MKTILEILKLSTDHLQNKGIRNPRRQAEEIISDALNLSRLELYSQADHPLTQSETDKCRESLLRRARGEPSQYIRGKVEFMDCSISVSPDVLIPRQETEILVDKMIKILSKENVKDKVLWDVCCGSGCIGIALKKHLPDLQVTLSDLSPKALAIAKQNAFLNKVEVSFLEGNLLTPFQAKKADIIVCNPPYISQEEMSKLDIEVGRYEPHLALLGGKTGLEFYEKLSEQLPSYLMPHGRVWLETGTGQGSAIKKLFNQSIWVNANIEQDWAGHDRFFFLEIE